MNINKHISILVLAIIASLSACTQTTLTKQPKLGIPWVASAAEYDALTLQAYQSASRQLDELIEDKNASAQAACLAPLNLSRPRGTKA